MDFFINCFVIYTIISAAALFGQSVTRLNTKADIFFQWVTNICAWAAIPFAFSWLIYFIVTF